MPSLDGLRAIAVIFVLLYHGTDAVDLPAIARPSGGFLGVEMFFVISGFLITSLLVHEHERSGSIDLTAFWVRRARRLLPALYAFLLGAIAMAALFAHDAMAKIRSEILGALLYVTNWLLIFRDESYFESSTRPSFLRHLWSLAIEEQFYIFWPLVVLVGLRVFSRGQMAWLTLGGALLSTAVMWILFERVDDFGDVTSIYFRTDSRAAGLLVGSAAAFVWRPWSPVPGGSSGVGPSRFLTRAHPLGGDVAGALALAFVIGVQYWFTGDLVEWGKYEVLFRGGFLLTSVPTLVVIAAVAIPRSRLGTMLGWAPLVWMGARSYGIYLWHWPVFQLTRPGVDVENAGWGILLVRLAITLILADLSYALLEKPVRQGRFTTQLGTHVADPQKAMRWGGIGLICVATVALFAPATNSSSPYELTALGEQETSNDATPEEEVDDVSNPPSTDEPAGALSSPVAPTTTVPPSESGEPASDVGVQESDAAAAPAPTTGTETTVATSTTATVVVVGDSVVLGARDELSKIADQVLIDAEVGRQWWDAPDHISRLGSQRSAADYIVVHLGNNGSLNQQMFDDVMEAIGDGPIVVFATVSAPRTWESTVNSIIREGVARWPSRSRIADWNSVAEGRPEFFAEDRVHLNPPGQRAFRDLLISVMEERSIDDVDRE